MINKFDQFITPHKYDYDWVVSIEIVSDTKKMYVFNVYLPYDKNYNEEEHLDRFTKIHNLLAECDRYKWTSWLKLPKGTYTYVSDAWGLG